jgi:pilus assembly protein CpaE
VSGITVVSGQGATEERLAALFGREHAVRTVWSQGWSDPADAADEACAASPLCVVLGPDLDDADLRDILTAIDRRHPSVGVVVLHPGPNAEATVELLRLGARDVLPVDASSESVQASLVRVLDLAAQRRASVGAEAPGDRRRVIAVLGPKGGSGKTTVATNLAVGMAKAMPNRVLLLDFDIQFGDVCSALGMVPQHSLADIDERDVLNRTQLKMVLTQHETSLFVLPPPESLARSDDIDRDAVKLMLGALTEEFPVVVIDTSAGIDEYALIALEFATDLVFVSTTDVPSIRAIARQVEAFDALNLTAPRRFFVLNRSDARVGLARNDIEAMVGLPATYLIPSSRAVPISTNQGKTLVEVGGRDPATKAVHALVEGFLPERHDGSRRRLRRSR